MLCSSSTTTNSKVYLEDTQFRFRINVFCLRSRTFYQYPIAPYTASFRVLPHGSTSLEFSYLVTIFLRRHVSPLAVFLPQFNYPQRFKNVTGFIKKYTRTKVKGSSTYFGRSEIYSLFLKYKETKSKFDS